MSYFTIAHRFLTVLWALVSFHLFYQGTPAHGSLADRVSIQLQNKIQSILLDHELDCQGERLCGSAALPLFYKRREFQPAWQSDGIILSQADTLIDSIKKADLDGMRPTDYHLEHLEQVLSLVRRKETKSIGSDPGKLACMDLLLTDAFLLYSSHLLAGRVNPETIYPEWDASNPTLDLAEILEHAIGFNRIAGTLNELRPPHLGYQNLKTALAYYRKIAERGGWPILTVKSSLRKGDRGSDMQQLRRRLLFFDPLQPAARSNAAIFDAELEQMVIRFQKIHGLTADGVVGPQTLKALNVPAEIRVRQMELNLERWRWIPHDLGQRYILVNVADYSLAVVENSQEIMTMRVVVGEPYWQTPVFSGKMTYLVVNPYWNIPHMIAVEDILPKIQNETGYLTPKAIRVFESWREGAPEIDPASIDWSTINASNFNYKLRQDPGPQNPLGRLKFIFPNEYAVYLHDTPQKHLFAKESRDFSHGCIRVEKPLDLAAYIVNDDPEWTLEKIMDAIDSGEKTIINILHPINVHVLYWTAWADQEGNIHFRDDIYNRDLPLDQALKRRRSSNHKVGEMAACFTNTSPLRYRHAQNLTGDNSRPPHPSAPSQSVADD